MDIALPDLGENIEEAEILQVLVQKGDAVTQDQPLLELETDKATFELPCPQAGTVSAIHVKKGDTVRVGQKILTIEAGAPAGKDGGTSKAASAPARKRIGPPERAGDAGPEERDEDERESAGAERPARARERAEKPPAGGRPGAERRPERDGDEDGDPREEAEVSGESRTADSPGGSPKAEIREESRRGEAPGESRGARSNEESRTAEARGRSRRAEGRDESRRGEARGESKEEAPEPEAERDESRVEAREPETRRGAAEGKGAATVADVAAGPATRRLARELEVDLLRIRGTGSGGRITPEDVQAFVQDRAAAARPATTHRAGVRPTTTPTAAAAVAPAPDAERWGPVERRPLTGIEKAAARHLSASWSEIPHVTHHDHADVTELEESRRRYESGRQESEPKLTWTALVVKAVAAGLRAFPRFNSSLDATREELVLKRYVHVGVAVDTEHGLLVPVVRDADRKTTREIVAEIEGLAGRARERKLAREEMQGASFTVTNLGGIGGIAFTPIVSRPEVAILGVSRSREELALREGQIVRRIVLPLSLSYDHRVINGADAARFVRYLAELLEDPVHLLLES
jgi:pyruvate dehydrogenase E2 component (dihydrolipoamide acetyltransferase)